MPKRPILSWFGGKYYMVKKLLPLIPEHKHYVEVYGGAASLLVNKEPSPIETYNDLNNGLVALFRVIKDEQKVKEFIKNITLTLYSRQEFNDAKGWDKCADEFEKAQKFYIRYRMSHGGAGCGFATTKNFVRNAMASQVSKYLTAIPLLWEMHKRFRTVTIENMPALKLIANYDSADTFFYLDPPYVKSTRVNKDDYDYEMSDTDHADLVDTLLTIKGKALLSGYDNSIYKKLEDNGWKIKSWEQRKHLNKKILREEKVWFNYEIDG